ncbi:MAG: rod shape-determining protein RodA [Synergistaceae bacterium]|jgi:rod shape determining protein RodA|nr:rod shape-determining protein RodA [Synergistaceae bacterium]
MGESRLFVFKEDLAVLDKPLFGSVALLVLFGVACIYSAGAGGGRGAGYAFRQLGWCAVSCLLYIAVVTVGYRRFMELAYPIYGLALLTLALTAVIAPEVKGAQRALSLGFIRIQPSEFGKISLILILSKFLSRYPPFTLKTFAAGLAVGFPALFLVLIQPDAGSALVYAVIIFAALFVAGTPFKYLGSLVGLSSAMLPFAWFFLKDYQKMRLLVFLDPTRDPLGAGYNVIQSRIAVGSGGVWGKGFFQGLQSKLRFLPEPHTDFIFSVYAEEFGFWCSVGLLCVFALVFTRIVGAGMKSRDVQGKFIAAGTAAWIWFQMFESIGMSMGLMPVTGIPMPFLSYGGSSLLSLSIALGLVASVHASSTRRISEKIFNSGGF